MAGVRHITSTISDSYAEVRSRTRLNGREVLGFQVFRSKGSSDTAVEKGVQQALQTLAANYPDIQMTEVHNSVNTTKENYDVAIATLLEGEALTVLVVWLFLRNWRATLVAAIALLLSILPAFWIMKLLGYTLNSISLLAITLVIGILVDDAIVEIENIETHIHQGKRPFQAALDASDAIGWAVLAITASIVAVFLPVSFIDGMTGQYRRQCRTL
ncbi:efflux RND transporter permease subunit [[Pasteurella] aerogenes]|nr:efflux RND transporter permease subunit [[Pasteurella] aerogenes]